MCPEQGEFVFFSGAGKSGEKTKKERNWIPTSYRQDGPSCAGLTEGHRPSSMEAGDKDSAPDTEH